MISISLILSVFRSRLDVAIILVMIYLAMQIIGYYKLFDKAGEKRLYCFIPMLNEYTETKIAWKGGVYWQMLLLAVGATLFSRLTDMTDGMIDTLCLLCMGLCFAGGLILNIKRSYRLAQAFGKDKAFAVGIFIFPPLFHIILGFGSAEYSRTVPRRSLY